MKRVLLVGVKESFLETLRARLSSLGRSAEVVRSPDVSSALSTVLSGPFDLVVIDETTSLFTDEQEFGKGEGFKLARLLASRVEGLNVALVTHGNVEETRKSPVPLVVEKAEAVIGLLYQNIQNLRFTEILVVGKGGDVTLAEGCTDPEMRVDLLEFLRLKGVTIAQALGEAGPGQILAHQSGRSLFSNLGGDKMAFGLVQETDGDNSLAVHNLRRFQVFINLG